jgi:uncharacterized protein involved in exopolysaccharide biosynthesis
MSEENMTFRATDVIHQSFQGWQGFILLGLLGAIVGFVISFILSPRYEAIAAITVSVDYGRTEIDSLVTEDRILDRIWQLMISDQTFEIVIDELNETHGEQQAWSSIETLRKHTRLDARLSRWEMIGIHSDPEFAKAIANAWKKINLERLDAAMEHAWRAQSLQGVSFEIGCVNLLTGEEAEALYHCVTVGEGVSPNVVDELREEITASHGIHPGTSYELVQHATTPQRAVLWPRGVLIFSGAMMGVIVGFFLALRNIKQDDEG